VIHISIFIAIDIQQDSYGYLCPVFYDLESLKEEYPDSEWIEIELDQFNIFEN